MHTAAISYRVADFLKQHPPFHSVDEPDLLALVARGRVKFHESGEYLCWQNTKYAPFLFVIQQGVVSLWQDTGGKETLRDIHGPGDIIGIERFLGSQAYPYSAKSNGDVMVYALPAADFEPLLARYPQVARYVEAYATAGAIYEDASREGVHKMFVVDLARQSEPLSCSPDCTVAEAAQKLCTSNSESLIVVRDDKLDGLLTRNHVLGWVADGGSASHLVKDIMGAAPPAVLPQTSVSDCVLTMSRSSSSMLAITADGTSNGGLLRLISAGDLQPAFGDNPLSILHRIAHASSLEGLRALHLRARAFVVSQLQEPSAIDWLAAFADRINLTMVKRLAELPGGANGDWSWCFWGAAGRRELLGPVEPEIALIVRDSADVSRGRRALDRLRGDLAQCGYLPHATPECGEEILSATVATWQERFRQWIRDPILSEMYTARQLFDLRPALGNQDAWRCLETTTRETIRSEPSFQRLLAHDCLSALPPLTFFQDAVVDESGERTGIFALQHRGLDPIVEVGRVFAIVNESVLGSSTLERLELARSRTPVHERIFREAAETLRVLLYLQARTSLRRRDSGAEILPSQLSRFDRHALKSGFRAIHNLLEFTVNRLRDKGAR